jgi:hypothetical protein
VKPGKNAVLEGGSAVELAKDGAAGIISSKPSTKKNPAEAGF